MRRKPARPCSSALKYISLPAVLLALLINTAPVSADMVRIYVTNAAGDNVHVIDPATKKVALSGHPNNIAVSKDGGRVVVAIAEQPGALDFIDTVSLTRAKTVPVNGRQHNVYVTPDGKYSVSGSTRTGVISVVDLQTEQPAWEVKLDAGIRPMTFEVNADGSTRRVYAQLSNLNGFAVVDFSARKEVDRIKLPDDPTGYGAQENRLGSPSHGIGVAPDGKTLWVTSLSANAVFVYALPELKLKGFSQPLGALPNWVAFTPDSKLVYVSNSGIKSVSAINTSAMKVVANIPVGEVPKRINTLAMR